MKYEQEKKRGVQEMKKEGRRILVMWTNKQERKMSRKEGSSCSKQGEG